jgi:hypothetical protein
VASLRGGTGWRAYQLTILAVSGLVCLTELMPPRMSTNLFTPLTCISATLILPLPN